MDCNIYCTLNNQSLFYWDKLSSQEENISHNYQNHSLISHKIPYNGKNCNAESVKKYRIFHQNTGMCIETIYYIVFTLLSSTELALYIINFSDNYTVYGCRNTTIVKTHKKNSVKYRTLMPLQTCPHPLGVVLSEYLLSNPNIFLSLSSLVAFCFYSRVCI